MHIFNSSKPSLKEPESLIWRTQIRERRAADADIPVDHRKKKGVAAMRGRYMTQSAPPTYQVGLKNILWANDTATANEIEAELELESFEWELHPAHNLPVCKEDQQCKTCTQYFDHLEKRMDQKDDADEDMEDVRVEGHGDDDEDDDDEDDDEMKSECMRKLFLLMNIQAREEAFKFNHEDPRGMGQFQGLLVTTNVEKLEAQADRDRALAAEATTRAELAQLRQYNEGLEERLREARAEIASSNQMMMQLQRSFEELAKQHQPTVQETRPGAV
jgi:hypothetical protein